MSTSFATVLSQQLGPALPKGLRFKIHHVSSFPTPCPAIFSPAPDQVPEYTTCESQFLSVAIDLNGVQTQAFALEALVYTTDTLTTLFVSKADSTGYLHLLPLAKGTPSPIKTVISTFLQLLVERKRRAGVRLVLSLFARAQDQYLFPGSIENKAKHVLDDRGLIRWWCCILDTVLQAYSIDQSSAHGGTDASDDDSSFSSCGYLRIPGCDSYETKLFFPDHVRYSSSKVSRWLPTDPLRALGKPPQVPERCLIPRFPDDPKARFVIDLDDELLVSSSQVQNSSLKSGQSGKWRSVRSMEEFWEMMAFRQECAAGRLVGFLWVVLAPEDPLKPSDVMSKALFNGTGDPPLPTPLPSQTCDESSYPQPLPSISAPSPPCKEVGLEPTDSVPQPSSPNTKDGVAFNGSISTSSVILPEPVYTRIMSVLQQLDYASIDVAADSTRRWLDAVAMEAGCKQWGIEVCGSKENTAPDTYGTGMQEAPTLALGPELVRRKKRGTEELDGVEKVASVPEGVQVLGAALIRKKVKVRAPVPDN